MEKTTLTRKELYDLVWSTPMTAISKKYEISSDRLKGICKKVNVPMPDNGYWQKLHYKKPVTIKELPDEISSDKEIVLNAIDKNVEISSSEILIRKKLIKEIEDIHDLPIQVPLKLTNPDRLIIEAKESLTVDKQFNRDYNGLISTKSGLVSITVTQESIGRALRFMDAFIKLLRARGHELIINQGTTYAVVFGEEIVICLQEKLRIEYTINKYNWRNREYHPSGILMFRMWKHFWWHQKVCMDGKQLIEFQLPKILANIELYAKKEIEEQRISELARIKREEEQKILLEEQLIEKEIRKQKKKEYRAFKELFIQASRLHQANILRDYIQTVEANAIRSGNITDEMQSWINWAKRKVEWYDPLINREDPLLDDNYKTNLFKTSLKNGSKCY
jgi:hypothetical protein